MVFYQKFVVRLACFTVLNLIISLTEPLKTADWPGDCLQVLETNASIRTSFGRFFWLALLVLFFV